MNNIILQSICSGDYQPNIVIAILLGLYCAKDNILVIDKKNLGIVEPHYNELLNAIIDSTKIHDIYPLIDKLEDTDSIILKVDGFRYDKNLKKDVLYRTYFQEMLEKYINLFREDLLKSLVNMPSWKTLNNKFISSIDTSCILKDYKMEGLQYIQVIAYYVFKHLVHVNWLIFKPDCADNCDILVDSSWKVCMSLYVNGLIKIIEDREVEKSGSETKKLIKYSAKELKFINYLKDNVEADVYRIEPDEILEALNPDGHIDGIVCKNPNKYVSNFISRLNKKYLHNTGKKLVECKEFRNCYIVLNHFEDFKDFEDF